MVAERLAKLNSMEDIVHAYKKLYANEIALGEQVLQAIATANLGAARSKKALNMVESILWSMSDYLDEQAGLQRPPRRATPEAEPPKAADE